MHFYIPPFGCGFIAGSAVMLAALVILAFLAGKHKEKQEPQ